MPELHTIFYPSNLSIDVCEYCTNIVTCNYLKALNEQLVNIKGLIVTTKISLLQLQGMPYGKGVHFILLCLYYILIYHCFVLTTSLELNESTGLSQHF